ncbi:unnamed protein product [Ilex paraguariensis]|uniref:Transcriptional factor DELLA N-terminal domain-containing protein n=1 Tax=Ilex paraguariensis TaxID=185542 RepID=A0ABC8U3F2_9AQUA
MKRDHQNLCQENFPCGVSATSNSSIGDGSSCGAGNFSMTTTHEKSKMWDETGQDARVDELLVIFGYKVESSDMAEVAQKLNCEFETPVLTQQDNWNPWDVWNLEILHPLKTSFDSRVFQHLESQNFWREREMKRDHQNLCQENFPCGVSATSNSSIGDGSSCGAGNFSMTTTHEKSKMWDETGQDARVDELLVIFGYKVESSDMAEVAQKLK